MEAFSQWCRRYGDSEMCQVSVSEACAAIHHAETNSENMDEDSWNSKRLLHVQLAMLHSPVGIRVFHFGAKKSNLKDTNVSCVGSFYL